MSNPDMQENYDEEARDDKGRWKPGYTGNPTGRPSFSIVRLIKEKLQTIDATQNVEVARAVVGKYIDDVLESGDGVAIRDLMDRFDGKPKQYIETSSAKEDEWIRLARELMDDADEEAEADSEVYDEAPSEADDS